jgi:hypothetical protein
MVITESTMTHGCCFSKGSACGGGQRKADDDVHASFGGCVRWMEVIFSLGHQFHVGK